MWFLRILGVVVGLILGAAMSGFAGALLLAALGAWAFPLMFGGKAQAAPLAGEFESAVEVRRLKQRVAELEQRVGALEQGREDATWVNPEEWAVSPALTPMPEAVSPTPAEVPPEIRPEPAKAEALSLAAELSLRAAAPAPEDESPTSVAESLAAEAALPPPAPEPPAPRAARPPKPSAPPPIPLRERLPVPIANLIFGGNLLVKLGVLILFLGLAFLLRYTAERVTVPLELRYAGVALAGAALLALGWALRKKRADYALVLQGAGVGVLYLTTLAAMKLHELLPVTAGFTLLFAVAVLSAALAVLQNAPVLAIVAALEGFAAPVLASTGENRPLALFSYLLVLDLGIALIAWFRAWRLLNLIGFVGTFTLAAGWARQYYSDDQFGIAQPFLIVFFLLFTAIGLLFARRTLFDAPADAAQPLAERAMRTLHRVGRVDSALVFGVPMVAFGMQYLLMLPWPEFGAAFSALALAAFYLLLGRLVFATQPAGLALLAEAYAIVGVIFGTLAIPLGLEGQWTGAAWAVEAAGMYWLGARQQRVYARAFSFVVLAGAVWKLLQDLRVDDLAGQPLLQGSVIGPALVAISAFVIWGIQRRAKLDDGDDWEELAGHALPWLGMAALTLLPWQWFTPTWAAAGTAVLASAAFAVAARFELRALTPVSYGMQALAVASFIATLHRGDSGQVLDAGWPGALAACLIALNVLGCAVWSMRQAQRAMLSREAPPVWTPVQIVGTLVGVGLLHLASLFQLNLALAALLWPLSALVALWLALRLAHLPLALFTGLLQIIAAGMFIAAPEAETAGAAFASLGFWTPVVLGLAALLAGDWLRGEARRAASQTSGSRWRNPWCAQPAALWLPVIWGLFWWLTGMLNEVSAVLIDNGLGAAQPAAFIAVLLMTSALAAFVARRRDWRQLGAATIMTLPGFGVIALFGLNIVDPAGFVPSRDWGWAAWPLALLWHLRLLWLQRQWFSDKALAAFHIAGFWLFLLLAARECQWQLGGLGDAWSAWPLLGWALMPALALWALRSRLLLTRWPVAAQRVSYLEVAALPVAAGLYLWVWVANAFSAGDAAPLPYVPLLNPLELMLWLALFAVALWWRALQASAPVRQLPPRAAQTVAGLTGLAILTATVLRACHHYAGVEWRFDALYDARLVQAALAITWALCGVGAMVLGHERRSRALWVAGAMLMGVVVGKLFFVDLAERGGLFRIISFISVGVLLLVVGYFAPVPPRLDESGPVPGTPEKEGQSA
ncbi:MAG: DUF2339 domain-containing protein [Azonexus sp.]|jgi:uncharacterized membrane protein|uniref:DUF2339 domain-containing protein n=1 Tax=Azonexus sp. TaxID=1872668 RepID=UPI00281B2612|nr:DUF2339 domain-containing protein [Azonexus sp.]MDR0777649.1 DUF2339 domain-containing protein [Azonexus sp.]